ncbi:MAG: 4-(cytidine 5'-diphospho)-2-C-methyl-D-erythritol kinase [Candidatus Omnitrophica bacterium]|nr:4-(cytidine 5'-diphospho)-2-C-methyl-D-erythritol kinase [Candidatus Omnitrophota bacterium]
MTQSIILPAYAKLNLALRITGRRQDGFHTLHTLFERIDLCDDLRFTATATPEILISCDNPVVPVDSRNLVYKAAKLLQDEFGVRQGARISIVKRIPVAAGLAGGSSNAATALMGLNRLWSLGLSNKDMLPFARQLGSDVAFFLYDIPWGIGTGRGDIIKPAAISSKLTHLLITPKVPVLTKDVYGIYASRFSGRSGAGGGVDFSLTKLDDAVTILICSLRKNDIIGAGARLFNDLESSILTLRPGLLRLKLRLQKSPVLGVAFSGSGPSIFAVTETQKDAELLKERFARTYRQVFVVKTRF